MPCSPGKARRLLKNNKAKVVSKLPFTIKLLYGSSQYKQPIIAGMDTGSRVIGTAAISSGRVIYQAEIHIRQDVYRKMTQRSMYRRNRRGRKTRYRPARWLNRASSKREGRLTPSIKSKVDSHLREKKQMESILPITKWHIETASFDIHKITNPDVKKADYQNGDQKGFYNLRAYILHRDNYQCQKCKAKNTILQVHHIIPRSKGGTNTPSNLITLCESCHKAVHNGEFKLRARPPATKHATEIGIVKSQLKKVWNFEETFGYETKFKREQILKLPKTHYNDAIAVCCAEGETVESYDILYQKRHVAKGDYQQTKGSHSQIKIPTGKLFGIRKFDYIQIPKCIGFVKGKRSNGYFTISDIFGKTINASVNIKKNRSRLRARTTTLIIGEALTSTA